MKSLAKTTLYYVIGVLIVTSLVGCKKDKESHYISSGPKNLAFTQDGGSREVSVSSGKKWKASSSEPSWCTVSPSSGDSEYSQTTVTVKENPGSGSRSAYIALREESGKKDTVRVLQTGKDLMIALFPLASTSVSRSQNSITVIVASNVGKWGVDSDAGWLVVPENISSEAQSCQLTIVPNAYLERTGTVSFKANGKIYKELTITQAQGADLVRGADSMALVQCYDSLSGNRWSSDKQWSFINNMTTWKGVTISGERVTELKLNNSNLQGKLPPQIAVLAKLKTISLIGNKLSGNLPSNLVQLTELEELSLSGNLYTTEIIKDILKIPSLKKLDLSNNKYNGTIPDLSALTNLEYLSLSDNQLSGSIPNSIGNLSKLQYLHLNNNKLSGNIPSDIGKLKELKVLRLFSNALSGIIPEELKNLTNLTHLELNNNQLTGSISESFGSLKKLIRLFLNNNQLTGSIPSTFENFASLENLSLANNQLTGTIPSQLGSLVKLENLFLNENQLSGNIPAKLGDLTGLTALYLSSNNLTGSVPAEIGNIKTLKFLYLDGNRLSGSLPESLLNHQNKDSFHFCPQQAGYNFDGYNCQN